MNKVVLLGRLTKDPDVRYTQGDSPKCSVRFTLAVDRKFKVQNGPTADFISCVAFGKVGEFFEKYCKQGTKVCLSGHIQTGSYDRQDGTKVYTTDVFVDEAEFAESKANSQASQQPAQGQTGLPPQGYNMQPQPGYQMPAQQYAGQTVPQGYAQQQFPGQPAGMPQQQMPQQGYANDGFVSTDNLSDEGLPFK